MVGVKKVLVCSDMSSGSDWALGRAALLVRDFGAECHLIHATDTDAVQHYSDLDTGIVSLPELASQEATRSLSAQIERCWPADLPQPTIVVTSGNPLTSIPDYASSHAMDIVVLGFQRAGVMEKLFLGTTATRLIKRLSVPVLVVRNTPDQPYQKILIPVDFSLYAEQALLQVRRLTSTATLVLMHAFESVYEGYLTQAGIDDATIHRYRIAARDQAFKRLLALAEQGGLKQDDYTMQLVHGNPYEEILTTAESLKVDCIALGKQGRNFVNDLLMGSVTKHVLLKAKADVLIQPASKLS